MLGGFFKRFTKRERNKSKSSDILANKGTEDLGISSIPKDEQKIEKLADKKVELLSKVTEIDDEIIAIQRSTRTNIRFLSPAHNNLRMKYKWYYKWHLYKYASVIHYLVLISYILLIAATFYYASGAGWKIARQLRPDVSTMAAVTFVVSGAGDASYNGAYVEAGTQNGDPYYIYNANRYLYRATNPTGTEYWRLNATMQADATAPVTAWYYGAAGGALPANTWTKGTPGTAPAPTLSAGSISISGTCKQYDRTTNCANSEVVKVAVNGSLKAETGTTSTGAWSIAGVAVSANDIITVFVDNVADANEAVAVAKVAATPANITGVTLFERHVTIGASSNLTLTNANLASYDNSVSGDEDIFFEVDASNNLLIPATGTQTATDQQLYLLASNPYAPDATGGKTITVPNLNLPTSATLTCGPNTFNLTASGTPFTRAGTFTISAETSLNYLGTSATNVTATTYKNLGLGTVADTGAGVTYTLVGTTTVSGILTVGNAASTNTDVLAANSRTVNFTASGTTFVVTTKGSFTYGTSTITYNGTNSSNVTGGITYYNLGVGTTNNANVTTYTLANDITVTNIITIGQATTNALDTFAFSDKTVTVNRATSSPFTVNTYGRFQADTSTVVYNLGSNVMSVAALAYYNLNITPTLTAARAYSTAGAVTVGGNFTLNPTASSAYALTFTLGGALTVTGSSTITKTTSATSLFETTSASNYAFSTGSLVVQTGGTVNLNASTVTISGSGTPITNSGTLNYLTASFVYTGASPTNVVALNYKNLTINHAGVTFTAAGDMTISGVFTITTGTFDASSRTITLSGTGTPFVNNGTLTPSTSTFVYSGVGDTTVASTTYNNLETKPSADLTGWTVAGAGDTAYNGTYLQSGIFNGQPAYTYNGKWLYYNYDEFMCMCYNWVLYTSKTNMADVGMQATYYTGTTLPGTWYENFMIMNGPAPSLTAYSATPVYTFTTGTLDVAGNYINGDGSHAVLTTAATNDPLVRVHGNYTNSSAGQFTFSDTANTYLSGNFSNSITGVINTSASLILFDGAAIQTVTTNGDDGVHDFHNVSVTNASAAGVVFADSITMSSFTATVASIKLTFTAGITVTVGNIALNGQGTGTRVSLLSSIAGTHWHLISADSTPTISNTSVMDSDASGGMGVEALTTAGNLDATGNTNWSFESATPRNISGALYTSDLANTVPVASKTLGLSVNGGVVTTVDTDGSGNYTFSSIPMRDDSIFTIFIKGETEKGSYVHKTGAISGDFSNVYLNVGHVKITGINGTTAVTNAMLDIADASGDADLEFSVSNGTATFDQRLNIRIDRLYQPGGNVVVDDIYFKGTFNIENNSVLVHGSWQNDAGTFTCGGSSTVTFDSSSAGETIAPDGDAFDQVVFNNASGGWAFSGVTTLNGDLTVTAGTLSGTENITVNGGDVSGNGTINLTGGTFLVDGVGNFGGDTNWTFSGLTFGDGTGSATTTKTGSGNVASSGVLTIAANQTLGAGDDTWTLSGSGTPFVIGGTFQEGTSTLIYTGASATNVTGTTYYNMKVNQAGTTFTSAGATEVKSVFTIQAGTFNASNSTVVLSGTGTPFVKTGTFAPSTSTIRYTGGGSTNIVSTDYYNLETKPAPSTSPLGNGLSLGGGVSRVAAITNAALNITTNLTLEAWIRLDADGNNSGVIYKGNGAGQGEYALLVYQNNLYFRLNGSVTSGSGQVISTSSIPTGGALHHIAATYDGSKQRVWLDGTQVGEANYSTAITNTNVGLWVGNYYDGNYGLPAKFYASRVSSSVRYTASFTPSQSWVNDGTTAVLWNYEDGSGTAINDSSSNNIDGTVSGTYGWVGAPVAGDGSGWAVSGSLNAGYTGNYVVDGTYGGNNKPSYTNGTNWMFNDNSEYGGEMWCMAASKSHLYDSMSCMYYASGATLPGTWYPGMEASGTPVLTAIEGGYPYTLTSGTLNATGNLVNGNGTNKVVLDATTNDPIVNIDGALTISANARLIASNSAAFSVASDFTNNGKLTDSTGTLTFDGQGLQTITAGGTDADHDFTNLTVTNASVAGVSFADSATVTGTFTDVTASSKLTFHAGSTYAFANININGQASGTRVILKSSTDTQHWHLNVTQASPSVSYVSARDSDASGGNGISAVIGSSDGTGNTNWTFSGTTITVSGTVYTAENKSTNIGENKTVRIVVNGDAGSSTTVETTAGGVFSFGGIVLSTNNPVLVYLSGETEKASLVTQAATATSDITGLELYTNHIVLTHESAGPLTNAIIGTAITATDVDNLMTIDGSSNVTFSVLDNIETWIQGGKTYTPGAEAYFGSLDILSTATFNPENNLIAMNDSGTPFAINGTFNVAGSTVLYQGLNATNITATTYKNLKVNQAGTTFTAAGNITVSGVFTIEAGTFDASDKTITLSGAGTPFVKTGTLTASTSTFKYTGAGATTVAAADYHNLETVPASAPAGGGGWIVSSAVDTSYNGTYTASGTMNGKDKYTNGSRWLFYNYAMMMDSYHWGMYSAASDCGDPSFCLAYYQWPSAATPPGTWYAGQGYSGTPSFAEAPSSYVYTLSSGTFNIGGNYTNGTESVIVETNATTNDPIMNIDGNFANLAGSTFIASNSAAFSVASNFTNSATGKFTDSGGTLTLDGQGLQTITAGGTTANFDFTNLTVTNADSTNGVAFADSVTVTGTFTDVTASSKVTFHSTSTYAFNAININGQATGTRITLTSSSSGSAWNLNITAASPTANYVTVKDSNANKDIDATTGGYDNTGNTHWVFPVTVYVSGTVYTAENKGSNIGANKTVALSINGGTKVTDETDASGIFRFDDLNIGTNNPITLFLDGETEKGSLVTIAANGTSAISSLEMFTNRIVLTHASAGPMSNAVLATADNACTADCLFSVDGSSVATFASAKEAFVPTTKTYTPGAAIIADDLELDGTLTLAGNAATIHGSWDSADGFFSSSGTVTFDAASGTETLNTGGVGGDGGWTVTNSPGDSSYGGTYTPSGTHNGQTSYTNGSKWLYYNLDNMGPSYYWVMYTSVTDLMDAGMSAGYYDGATLPGTWYENWNLMNGPAPTLSAVTAHGGSFTNITKSGGGTLQLASSAIDIDGTLSISATNTFDINGQTITLATLSNDGTFKLQGAESVAITSLDTNSGTIEYSGASTYSSLLLGDTYAGLKINGTGGTWTLDADLAVSGVLDINAGTLSASSRTITLSGSGTPFIVTGTFSEGTSTVIYTGSSDTNVAGSTYKNLKLNHAGTTFTAVGDTLVKSVLTIEAGTFDASNRTITLSGSGTPFVKTGTFIASTSTFAYTSPYDTNITAADYYHLDLIDPPEWLTGWAKRVKVEVLDTNIDSDLTNFPLMLKLGASVGTGSDDTTAVFDEVGSNSQKIAVTTTDGTTEIYVEVEKWDSVGEEAILWVSKSDLVFSGSATTDLYLYYDNNHANNTTYVGATGSRPEVWDSNYTAVYHSNQTTNAQMIDSTGDHNATPGKTSGSNPISTTSGKIGSAFIYDSSDQRKFTTDITSGKTLTWEAWANASAYTGYHSMLSVSTSYLLFDQAGNGLAMYSTDGMGGNNGGVSGLSTSTFYRMVFVRVADSTTGGYKFYKDGAATGTTYNTGTWSGSSQIVIGNRDNSLDQGFEGILDEVRVSSSVRSAAWIKADYYAQTDGLVNWGTEEGAPGSAVYTMGSGTFNIDGNLTIGNSTDEMSVNADTNDPIINVDGNMTITANSTFIASGAATFSVASNFSDSGIFTDSSGSLTLDGQGLQTITAGGTDGNHDFNNLIVTNASVAGVEFADSATVAGTFTDVTASSKVTFHSGSTYAFNAININGQAEGTRVTLTSSSSGSAWNLNITATSPTASNVSVKDSNANKDIDATTGGEDLTGNTHWLFPSTGATISGTAYSAENKSTNIGASKTIALSINGATATTVETTTGGVFSFTSITVAANNTVSLFIDDEAEKASFITQASGAGDITGIELFTSHIVLAHATAGPMTNTLLATADNVADTDLLVAANGSEATFTAGNEIWILGGKTYTPGGNVIAGSIEVLATAVFSPEANTITLNDSGTPLTVAGTFNESNSNIIYNGLDAVNVTGTTYHDLTVNSVNQYKKSVSVTNGSGGILTDYQVKITLTNANFDFANSTNDGRDIRFYDSDNITALSFFIESWNQASETATIWVKIPSIPTDGKSIGLHYGNPGLTTASSGSNTFMSFDNFSDDAIGTQWTATTGNGTIAESGGTVNFSYTGSQDDDWWTAKPQKILKLNSLPAGNIHAEVLLNNYTILDRTEAGIAVYQDDTHAYLWGRQDGASNNNFDLSRLGTANIASYASTTLPMRLAIRRIGSNYSFWSSSDGVSWTQTGSTYSDVTFNTIALFGKEWSTNNLSFSMDNFSIRQIAATEPTTSVGSASTTPMTAAGSITVSGVLTISAGTFDASDKTITLSGSGTPFVKTGTFTASTSTVKYTGAGDTTIAAATYYNLETSPSAAGAGGFVASGATNATAFNDTYLANGTNDGQTAYQGQTGLKWLYYCTIYGHYMLSTNKSCSPAREYEGGVTPSGAYGVISGASPAPTVSAAAGTYTFTFASGTFNITGNYVNGNGTNAVNTTADTNDPILNIDGSFSNAAGASFAASGSASFSIASDFANNATGKFVDSSGTLTLDGQGPQTVTAGGTDADHNFNNLTVTNASVAGVEFADSTTIAGTFTDVTASSKVTFHSGSTYAFNAININGQAEGTRVTLTSSSSGSAWNLNITAASPTASNVSVKDSNANKDIDATTGGEDLTGNTHWLFPSSNSAPTNDSLTFTNPYSSNIAVADDTTEWNFRALVSDTDGVANLNYTELRLANSADSSQPFDSIKLRWTQDTDTFSEEVDTQNAITLTGTSTGSANQKTLNFNIKIDNDFLAKDTNYAAEIYSVDDSSASDSDNYSNIYQVKTLALSLSLDSNTLSFGNLLPGSVLTGSTTATITSNFPNGFSLSVHDGITGSNSVLLHQGDSTTRISDYAGTIASPSQWLSGTGLGICVYSATGKNAKWGSGATANDASNYYAGIPETATILHSKTGSPTTSDQTAIGYKLVVPNTQKTGDYQGTITYTATGVLN